MGIAVGSFYAVEVWILFLIVGFCIALIFLLKNKKISSNTNYERGLKNTACDKNNLKDIKNIFSDEMGQGTKIINLASFRNLFPLALFVFIIFFSLGLIRIEINKLTNNDISFIENLNGEEILLQGKISEAPSIRNGKQKIVLSNIKNEQIENSLSRLGNVIVYLERYPEYNRGDEISLKGKLNVPEDFDGFEYQDYLFAQGIYFVVYYPKVELIENADKDIQLQIAIYRKRASEVARKIYSQPQAGIINAMVLGEKSDLSDETLEGFNRTGTRHIIAISGLHMTIIGVLIMFLLLAFGLNRNFAFYLAVLGIFFYVTLVGFPPSAVRASVMSVMILLAVKVGRISSAGIAVIFAGSLMLLFNPNLLRYDTGFQLSFLAVLGIIYIFPKLDSLFKKYPDFLKIKSMFLITISAQIATLPIIMKSFGQFFVLSVFANILVLPFVPVVMIGGIISIMAGFVNLVIGQILVVPVWLILSLQLAIINFFAGVEFGFFSFEKISIWFGIVYYGILILLLNIKK
ncbi:ComEC family competence protein [Patescibacteria group bacterium]|nr:ComEC family competence protein [Patescibacteria group bacterium]